MTPTLHINLLGQFRLLVDDTPIMAVNTPRLQILLAYLVLHPNVPISRQQLAFLFWPDSSETAAHTNLRSLVYQLRHTLPDCEQFFQVQRSTLQWRSDHRCVLDLSAFESALLRANEATEIGTQRAALEEAVSLYTGDLVPGCYDQWIMLRREQVRNQFLGALEQLVLVLEADHHFAEAIVNGQLLLHHDPLHEATYRHLMRLLAAHGDRTGALRTYHTCAAVLERELGVKPSAATTNIYERLLGNVESHRPDVRTVATVGGTTTLVGRRPEWRRLHHAWQSAVAGHAHLVVIAGEAGIGKSRLAEEMSTWVARQGIAAAAARCYAAAGALAYAPVTAWLRSRPLPALDPQVISEVARLVPEVLIGRPAVQRPGPLGESWQRQHFFEALVRAICSLGQPLLLVVDDLQWADQETLEWLHYLLRFDPRAPILLVATVRSEELAAGHPFLHLRSSLQRDELVTEIELGPLAEADTIQLGSEVAGQELEATIARRLYQETEGNPLFVVEMVRASVRPSAANGRRGGPQGVALPDPLPAKMQAVIATRLAHLSPQAAELVTLAATVGRESTFDVLLKASDTDEDTLVRALDELWQRRILREHGTESYDFSHDKLREVAYAQLSPGRRRLLHRHVAEALVATHDGTLDAVSAQVAAHFQAARLSAQALPYYVRAAVVAHGVYANTEAIRYVREAFAMLAVLPTAEAQSDQSRTARADLHEMLGDIQGLIGQNDEARLAYAAALSLIPPADQPHRAHVYRKMGNTWRSQHDYAHAEQAYQQAEDVLGQTSADSSERRWHEWIEIQLERLFTWYLQAQWLLMAALAEQISLPIERYGVLAQRARFLIFVAATSMRRDRMAVSDDTLKTCQTALVLSQDAGNLSELSFAHMWLAGCYLWRGTFDEAEHHFQTALTLAERTGYMVIRAPSLTNLTTLYRRRGQIEAAHAYVARSLEVATAGREFAYLAAARGNQAWLAWQSGQLDEAQRHGEAALELWRKGSTAYPFHWVALWPLIAVSHARQQTAEAILYLRALLATDQVRLPPALAIIVASALQAWDDGQVSNAGTSVAAALALAPTFGFL